MANWLPSLLPRIAAFVLVALAATAGLTYAAGSGVPSAPDVPSGALPVTPPLIVPDVRNQAYVFAKGTLGDAGFAWRVTGSVRGYAANVVVSQSPAGGTPVVDSGTPLITLTLRRNGSYPQNGEAVDESPYGGTVPEPADLSGNPIGPAARAAAKQQTAKAKATTTTVTTTAAATTAATTTAATTTAATTTAAVTTTAAPTTAPHAAAKTAKAAKWPQTRPVAFVVPGATKEPLDEMPLPDRAKALGTWLDSHRTKSPAAAKYWLYQNEWIVTGAKMGWWHGAAALKTLIAIDRRTQSLWGIGAKSASAAQQALAEVQAKATS